MLTLADILALGKYNVKLGYIILSRLLRSSSAIQAAFRLIPLFDFHLPKYFNGKIRINV